MRQQYVRNTVYIGILQKANTPLTLKVGQASSPDIIMTNGDVCPTNRGESKSPLLGGDKGVGNEFAYIRKIAGFCKVKPNLIWENRCLMHKGQFSKVVCDGDIY